MLRRFALIVLVGCGSPATSFDIGIPVGDNPRLTGGVGSGCELDADCADPDLVCDLSFPGGLCTAACTDSPSQADEQAQCLDDPAATCLSAIADGPGACVRACDASADFGEVGACFDHEVCTGWWWHRDAPDASGCQPWCKDDDACGPYQVCDERLGACLRHGEADNPAGLPDGSPCSVSARNSIGRSIDCRGDCFFLSAGSDEGICASFIDVAVSRACPDHPDAMRPITSPGDAVGICIFKDCDDDRDCTAPLECGACPAGFRDCCRYP